MSNGVRRRKARLIRAASLGAGLGLNLLMLSLLVLVPRSRTPPSQPLQVSLLPPLGPVIARKAPVRRRAGQTAPVAARPVAPTGPGPARVATGADEAPGPPGPNPAGQAAGAPDIGSVLRANLGCSDPGGYRLTPEERARCLERLGRGAQQAQAIPAPIDPGKRAWFDATVAAYHSEGHLPAPVCKLYFSGPKTKFKPAHGLKIPGLPCYLVPPKGFLTDEADVAPPEHVETR